LGRSSDNDSQILPDQLRAECIGEYNMARPSKHVAQLRKIITSLETLVRSMEAQQEVHSANGKNGKASGSRIRRSKNEVLALKKLLKSERKAGVPVAELAAKHGVSSAYIYMLR
jgi:hypothetical protein